jgi:hypothetical protein
LTTFNCVVDKSDLSAKSILEVGRQRFSAHFSSSQKSSQTSRRILY